MVSIYGHNFIIWVWLKIYSLFEGVLSAYLQVLNSENGKEAIECTKMCVYLIFFFILSKSS